MQGLIRGDRNYKAEALVECPDSLKIGIWETDGEFHRMRIFQAIAVACVVSLVGLIFVLVGPWILRPSSAFSSFNFSLGKVIGRLGLRLELNQFPV